MKTNEDRERPERSERAGRPGRSLTSQVAGLRVPEAGGQLLQGLGQGGHHVAQQPLLLCRAGPAGPAGQRLHCPLAPVEELTTGQTQPGPRGAPASPGATRSLFTRAGTTGTEQRKLRRGLHVAARARSDPASDTPRCATGPQRMRHPAAVHRSTCIPPIRPSLPPSQEAGAVITTPTLQARMLESQGLTENHATVTRLRARPQTRQGPWAPSTPRPSHLQLPGDRNQHDM